MNPYSKEKLYLIRNMVVDSLEEFEDVYSHAEIDDIQSGPAEGFLRAYLDDVRTCIRKDEDMFIEHCFDWYGPAEDIFLQNEEEFLEE